MDLLEVPKQMEHGHYALPVFSLAKEFRQAPPLIAQELSAKMNGEKTDFLAEITPLKGFINFKFSDNFLQKTLVEEVFGGPEKLGCRETHKGKKLVIDYASPNVAKPMSIGHLRATVIGQAIRNLCEAQGYEVVGINHLGDWGVQFGKLAWAFQEWGASYPFKEKPFESLYQLYVRFHEEAEKDEELNRRGAETFKKLEQGDSEIQKIWQMFLDISLTKYRQLLARLGVVHDLNQGESFYNKYLKSTEERLEKAGILEESEGAMVVKLDDQEMPPCLIRKSDGTSLYATRDLAAAIYRREEMKADRNLYVVGMDQTLHFNQLFSVIKKLGYDWWDTCHHISFGMYRFKEGRMSTRKGNVIFLEDVIEKAVELVGELIEEKNPNLENKAEVAEQVGIGAIIFNDLINDRVRNVDFDWDRVLDFDGSSGPYVQYCQVRCNSLIERYGREPKSSLAVVLSSKEERELVWRLLQFEEVVQNAAESFKPNYLAQYLVDICQQFNHFYQKHRVLGESSEVEASRITLVHCTRAVLRQGLKLLNIQSPLAM